MGIDFLVIDSMLGLPRWLSGKKQKTHLPVQETRVQSLGREDPLEKEMETHSSILAWDTLWREEPAWWATVHGVAKNWTGLSTHMGTRCQEDYLRWYPWRGAG